MSDNFTVADVMLDPTRFPVLPGSSILKLSLEEMSRFRLGIACLVDEKQKLVGVITDGDIRRRILNDQRPISALFIDDSLDHAISKPLTTTPDMKLSRAVDLMEMHQIWDLPVISTDLQLVGLLHLHAAVKMLLHVTQ